MNAKDLCEMEAMAAALEDAAIVATPRQVVNLMLSLHSNHWRLEEFPIEASEEMEA